MSCEQKKVYSGEFFAKNPPSWGWICEICLEQGTDDLGQQKPKIEIFKYLSLLEKVDPQGAENIGHAFVGRNK